MDEAHHVWDTFRGQYHSVQGIGPTKFRCVVLVGGRFDLLAKAVDKGKMLWTQWNPVVVQLQTKDRQSDRVRPTCALVFAPPSELTQTEPNVIQVPRFNRKDTTQYGRHLRCQEEHCIWRSEPARGSTLPADQDMDFHTDDRVNLLDAMLAEMDDQDINDEGTVDTDKPEAAIKGRDLWPFARTPSYYKELLCSLGASDKATAAVVLSTTAHPSHWLACRDLGLDTIVLTARWSDHCTGHRMHLAKQILVSNHRTDLALRPGIQASSEAHCQFFIEATIKLDVAEQVVEAYDVSQGIVWHDGLNRILQSLTSSSQKQVRTESESDGLRITGQTDIGRGLETLTAKREGEILCNASALFFDTHSDLVSLLCHPGNERFADRACKFSGDAVFKEKIAEFVPERLLTFDIIESPPDPELLGHLDAHRGQFELRDNGDGTTTLIGRTWYSLHVRPSSYFDWWTHDIFRAVHLRVMKHVKRLSESES